MQMIDSIYMNSVLCSLWLHWCYKEQISKIDIFRLEMLKLCTFCVQTKSKNGVKMSEPWGYGKDNGKFKNNLEEVSFKR